MGSPPPSRPRLRSVCRFRSESPPDKCRYRSSTPPSSDLEARLPRSTRSRGCKRLPNVSLGHNITIKKLMMLHRHADFHGTLDLSKPNLRSVVPIYLLLFPSLVSAAPIHFFGNWDDIEHQAEGQEAAGLKLFRPMDVYRILLYGEALFVDLENPPGHATTASLWISFSRLGISSSASSPSSPSQSPSP